MSNIRKPRKLNSAKIVFAIIVIAIFMICLIYNVIALFVHPSDTFMIDNGRISSSEEAKAYVIREEKLFQGENYKNSNYYYGKYYLCAIQFPSFSHFSKVTQY